MKYKSFDEVERVYSKLYREEKYKETLEILENIKILMSEDEIKRNYYNIMIDKARSLFRCNLHDEALDIIDSLINSGYMCPLWKFSPLNNNPRYKDLKAKNDLLRRAAEKEEELKYKVYVPQGYVKEKQYPLFISLHGDGEDAEYHNRFWEPEFLLKRGFVVVVPQSSQRIAHNSYVWNIKELYFQYEMEENTCDIEYFEMYSSMREELKRCYDSISKEYSIDHEKIIIGGFSGGAHAAIDMALSDRIPIKGAILLCSQKPTSFTVESAKNAAEKHIKWVFMEGEKDAPVQDVEEMIETLNNFGGSCNYIINHGVGHWYPEDLENKLDKALGFILN
ncbi:putative esterase [Clostridium punense]|uniref:Esterase n=1 Tax=Clostridium punense TaxID=1054297 RepID=A0ABS4K114_9CLOT|nr:MULTISPECIES: alpha/beta hydrolase [Clostridium]EQB87892.1 hypothetical protein M918_06630 [Clostridium sp. BL8]MBP2021472.1 putative esterase [Clostridium punense]